MLDPVAGVKVEAIQWFSNGVWKPMPHRHFFCNNLRQHFRRSNRHMPEHQKQVWTKLYVNSLLEKQVLHLNGITFKVDTTVNQQ